MERKQMANILIPAAAVALLVALVGAIAFSGGKAASSGGGSNIPATPHALSSTADGMSETMPPLDAPEWKGMEAGLKFWDVRVGTGEEVLKGQTLTCHYIGWLTTGTSFDGNLTRDPTKFGLNQVIQGWTKGLPGMKVGGIRRLYIPAELAYGSSGRPNIPSNSDLVFEVKVLVAR
jgi:FKBP-type peptidyl-prolyl cis-trans isomerase FkpA